MIADSLRCRAFYEAMQTAARSCGEMTLGLHCPYGELSYDEREPWGAAAAASLQRSPADAGERAFAAFNASLGRRRSWAGLTDKGRGVWRWAAADLRRENAK